MFYLSHVYAAAEITGKHPLILVGSTLPDIPIFSSTLDHNELHRKAFAFRRWLEKKGSPLVHLATGMMLHGELKTGLDFYAHKRYNSKRPGFVLQNMSIVGNLIKEYDLPISFNLKEASHSLFEIASDIILINKKLNAMRLMSDAAEKVDFNAIAKTTSEFFEGHLSAENLQDYYSLLNFNHDRTSNKFERMIELSLEMISRRAFNVVDQTIGDIIPDRLVVFASHEIEPLIESTMGMDGFRKTMKKAVELIKPDYWEFMGSSISLMKKNMSDLGFIFE